MTEPMRALESFSDVDVPLGARARVRARIEAHVDRRAITNGSSRRWMIGALVPVAILGLIMVWPRSDGRAIVAVGDHYEVALGSGQVSIHGPAELAMSGEQLSLVQGTVDARGELRVQGPACTVDVRGSAEVSVKGAQLTVRVFSGSVQITPPPPVNECEVIDLWSQRPIAASADRKTPAANVTPAAVDVVVPPPTQAADVTVAIPPARKPRVASRPREAPADRAIEPPVVASIETAQPAAPLDSTPPAPTPSVTPTSPTPSVAAPTDPLADAVAAYHAAVALEAQDLSAARLAWQTWRARWSKSPLAHSADLHLLGVLDKLDRHGEASDLAREFVQRYPRSPRRAEVERLIVGGR